MSGRKSDSGDGTRKKSKKTRKSEADHNGFRGALNLNLNLNSDVIVNECSRQDSRSSSSLRARSQGSASVIISINLQ